MLLCTQQTSILIWILHIALSDSFIVCSSFYGGFFSLSFFFVSFLFQSLVMQLLCHTYTYILLIKHIKFFQLNGCQPFTYTYLLKRTHTSNFFCCIFHNAWMWILFFSKIRTIVRQWEHKKEIAQARNDRIVG